MKGLPIGIAVVAAFLAVIAAFQIKSFRSAWFSWLWSNLAGGVAKKLHPRKRRLAEEHLPKNAVLLDLGAGLGHSIDDYTLLEKPLAKLILVEPNDHFAAKLSAAAAVKGYEDRIQILHEFGDKLSVPSGTVDVVLLSLVLCSVPDQFAVLAEAQRVLKPGGKVIFVEHVASTGIGKGEFLYLVQRILSQSGIWPAIGDGCHLDRETGRAIDSCTGWSSVSYAHFTEFMMGCIPMDHIAGVAVKA